MNPQTYNNFVGAQGSKPNIELITGVVKEFNVNPSWLLKGEGEIFSGEYIGVSNENLPIMPFPPKLDQASLQEMLGRVREMYSLVMEIGREFDARDFANVPPLTESIHDLKRNFVMRPKETSDEVGKMLTSFQQLISIQKKVLGRVGKDKAV